MKKIIQSLIEIEDLSKEFIIGKGQKKVQALKDINLTIYHSDYMVIFGPSGCGKSTLLNLILGIDKPTKGEIFINNKNINKMDEDKRGAFRAKRIGMVYQMPYWIKSLTVLENIALPLIVEGTNENIASKRAQAIMEELDMAKLAKQLPTQLSGGEQQRAGIARALVSDPPIVMADEPTGNLDSENADNVMKLFDYLNKYYKKTVILVTHNQDYWDTGNRKVEMKDGQILKDSKKQKKIINYE